jgi:serine/threonine protein kinase
MALSKHPNVLRVYGSFVNGSKLYIVTPYLAAGSCLDIMKSSFPDGFEEISIATTLRQALEGLIYLHKNGHIHRDVKAGNLLMDQQGTVLLADFGVSSSLAENGDVRKTFVGTPCWMAPEVMEQAGYDYKADIWSFGITALELATGHAPFAKFPPMKVLMMTLSNAPPTLDREGGKHKYSKAFKDMIDMCLQKDPSKRPSAEKLLLHPFFKQAKKRDYLVKSVLSSVLPLDKRPHRKIPQKHISFESTEQWDFDDDENNTLSDDDNHTTAAAEKPVNTATSASGTSTPQQQVQFQQQNVNENINTPAEAAVPTTVPLERSRSVVQFEDYIKANHLDRSKSTSSPSTHHHSSTDNNTSELPPIKKHISFGEVVIKDPPVVRSIMSPVTESPAPIMASSNESNTSLNYAPPTLSSAPTSKKSRFVIEDSAPTSQTSSNNSPAPAYDNVSSPPSGTPPISASEMASAGIGLGISAAPSNTSITNINTVSVINNSTPSSAAAAANITSNNNTLQEGEFKKGRFSVNQTPARPATPSDDAQQIVNGAPTTAANNEKSSYQQQQGDSKPTPMARAASQDSFSERKSRFEVKHSNNNNSNSALMATPISVASTPIEPGTPLHSLPLSRENSNTSALSRDSSVNAKVSRFSVEKPEAVGPYCELPTSASTAVPATTAAATAMSPECRKKGRFELTGGSDTNREFINHLESPQSTVGPSPVISPSNSLSRGQAHRILDPSMPHMVYSHMESLLKQTEIQKNMLHDLLATMPLLYNNGNNTIQQQQHIVPTRTRTISDSKKPSSSSSIAHNEEFYQR